MKTAANQIEKEIAKLQKQYDSQVSKYFASVNDSNRWGNGLLMQEAEKINAQKMILKRALTLLSQYDNK
jgi:hypothetical protein